LADFIDATNADELMVTAQMYDHTSRLRSFEIVAEVRDRLNTERSDGSLMTAVSAST
jgi:hypothetical protein